MTQDSVYYLIFSIVIVTSQELNLMNFETITIGTNRRKCLPTGRGSLDIFISSEGSPPLHSKVGQDTKFVSKEVP